MPQNSKFYIHKHTTPIDPENTLNASKPEQFTHILAPEGEQGKIKRTLKAFGKK